MIPTFPPDATIASIHLACFRSGIHQSLKSSARAVYGGIGNIHNNLGFKANAFVSLILKDKINQAELIDRHSMFPLISSILPPSSSNRLQLALAEGDTRAYTRCLALYRSGIKIPDALRLCPKCVHEDIKIFGTGHWHVIHQVPAIHICHTHGDLLHDQCAGCHTAFGKTTELGLPGDPCPRCGSIKTTSSLTANRSKGYIAFANLIDRIFQGNAPEIGPRTRVQVLKISIASANMDAQELLESLLAWWNVDSLQTLDALLQCRTSYQAALQLFTRGFAQVHVPFLSAAIAFAWEHISETDRHHLLQQVVLETDLFSGEARATQAGDRLREELTALASIYNLPDDVVMQLTNGSKSLAYALAGGTNLFLLFDGLSPSSKAELDSRFSNYGLDAKNRILTQRAKKNTSKIIPVIRQEIQKLIAKGCKSRSAIKQANATLYQKALCLDRPWLDEIIPSQHRVIKLSRHADLATKRKHYRAIILKAKMDGFSTRTELRSVCAGACDFAIRNDRRWFESIVGPKSRKR